MIASRTIRVRSWIAYHDKSELQCCSHNSVVINSSHSLVEICVRCHARGAPIDLQSLWGPARLSADGISVLCAAQVLFCFRILNFSNKMGGGGHNTNLLTYETLVHAISGAAVSTYTWFRNTLGIGYTGIGSCIILYQSHLLYYRAASSPWQRSFRWTLCGADCNVSLFKIHLLWRYKRHDQQKREQFKKKNIHHVFTVENIQYKKFIQNIDKSLWNRSVGKKVFNKLRIILNMCKIIKL